MIFKDFLPNFDLANKYFSFLKTDRIIYNHVKILNQLIVSASRLRKNAHVLILQNRVWKRSCH